MCVHVCIYIYVYIYVCVSVCVFVSVYVQTVPVHVYLLVACPSSAPCFRLDHASAQMEWQISSRSRTRSLLTWIPEGWRSLEMIPSILVNSTWNSKNLVLKSIFVWILAFLGPILDWGGAVGLRFDMGFDFGHSSRASRVSLYSVPWNDAIMKQRWLWIDVHLKVEVDKSSFHTQTTSDIWVCLKIGYPTIPWLIIIYPLKTQTHFLFFWRWFFGNQPRFPCSKWSGSQVHRVWGQGHFGSLGACVGEVQFEMREDHGGSIQSRSS